MIQDGTNMDFSTVDDTVPRELYNKLFKELNDNKRTINKLNITTNDLRCDVAMLTADIDDLTRVYNTEYDKRYVLENDNRLLSLKLNSKIDLLRDVYVTYEDILLIEIDNIPIIDRLVALGFYKNRNL